MKSAEQSGALSRREFLARALRFSSLAVPAMAFGRDVAAFCNSDMRRPVGLIYATRYGATRETAKWIRKGMAMPVELVDIERVSLPEVLAGYDRFIVGSGIWIDGPHKKVLEFFETERDGLRERLLGTFIVCGSADGSERGKQMIAHYLNRMHTSLPFMPPVSRAFGGRLVVRRLNEEDRNRLTSFYRTYLDQELHDWDLTNPGVARKFGSDIGTGLMVNR